MTLNQILYFQKVARLENYHQAAEELYISQPSLSRSMAVLESELGVALFEKKGRGVTLTKAGQLFLEHADRIAADCDVAVGKMQELSADGGKIDIGYIFPLAGHYIPHKVREFLAESYTGNRCESAYRRTGYRIWWLSEKRGYGIFSTQCTGAGDHYTKEASACRNPGSATFRDESLSRDWL